MARRWGLTTQEDLDAEAAVATELEAAWPGIRVHAFPRVCAVDWYLYREATATVMAVAEVKCRRVPSTHYPVEYPLLAVSKYGSLCHLQAALGVAPLFVVRFTDGVRWVDLRTYVPTSLPIIGGRRDRPGVANDLEPMLQVPMGLLRPLSQRPGWVRDPEW